MALVMFGGLIAHKFEGVAAFDEAEAFGGGLFEGDRVDFGAVLFGLQAPLVELVAVEFAFHALRGAMEDIDGRPE